jgi:hypothetical protein
MDSAAHKPARDPAASGSWERFVWPILLLALTCWQGWMTMSLFGGERSWERMVDGQVILSGRHPLHLYHGYLGARSLRDHGSPTCYDPNFQAGYPKTPIFDGGSRPAELFLLLGGGEFLPAAYKIGFAVSCLLVPLVLTFAGRGFGLRGTAAVLAAGLGLLAWWGRPGRDALEVGDLDLLVAGLAALCQYGLLVRWHLFPSPWNWLGAAVAGCMGWYCHPLFFLLLQPLTLIYYLSVGSRHGLFWHLALAAGLASGVGFNSFWLFDWGRSWWLRNPLQAPGMVLPHRTFHTLWNAPLWGEPADRALAILLTILAVVGVVWLNETRRRPAARLLGFTSAALLLLAIGGVVSEPLSRLGTAHLLTPALLCAALPAAHGLTEVLVYVVRTAGRRWHMALTALIVLGTTGYAARRHVDCWIARARGTAALEFGLTQQQTLLVSTLKERTTPEARILWEDEPRRPGDSWWTALLPYFTDRPFLGGLDADADIEHAHARLTNQALAGQSLAEVRNDGLAEFCRLYNVGWVVCRSPATIKRFREWPDAKETAALNCEGQGILFSLPRAPQGFVLKGRANWLAADSERIALGDVVPDPDGDEVVLSLHYQEGLRVLPSRVRLERHLDPKDPIPFIRLKMSGPVTCLTLTWDKR